MTKKAGSKKQKIAVVDGVITIEYPGIKKKMVIDFDKEYSDEIKYSALEHGFKQKFGDAASGKSAAEKYEEVQKIHASLLEGKWERTATIDLTPLICLAVSRIKGIALEKIEKSAGVDPEQVKTWASNLNVKAEIAKIRAERAAEAAEEEEDDDEIEVNLEDAE